MGGYWQHRIRQGTPAISHDLAVAAIPPMPMAGAKLEVGFTTNSGQLQESPTRSAAVVVRELRVNADPSCSLILVEQDRKRHISTGLAGKHRKSVQAHDLGTPLFQRPSRHL